MCHEPIIDITRLPEEIQKDVYRPDEGEVYNVESVSQVPKKHFVADDEPTEIKIET